MLQKELSITPLSSLTEHSPGFFSISGKVLGSVIINKVAIAGSASNEKKIALALFHAYIATSTPFMGIDLTALSGEIMIGNAHTRS